MKTVHEIKRECNQHQQSHDPKRNLDVFHSGEILRIFEDNALDNIGDILAFIGDRL